MAGIVFQNLFALLVIILAGYIMRKLEWLDDSSVSVLSRILMSLTLPVTIILSMQQPFTTDLLKGVLVVMGLSIFMIISMLGVGFLLSKLLKSGVKEKGVLIFATAFPNAVYIGMPVIRAVLGEDALFYVSMYVLVSYIISPTLGLYIMGRGIEKEETGQKKSFSIGIIIASITMGFLFFIFSIQLPVLIVQPMKMISNIMTPISMIIIGNNLAKEPLKELFKDKRLFIVSAVKLMVAPLLLYAVLSLLVTDPMITAVIVYIASMPVAALSTVYAAEVGADVILASRLVLVSTVLSMVSIPIMSLLIK